MRNADAPRPDHEIAPAGEPLRVGVVAPPFYEIPPTGYGGTELVCYGLVERLVDRGHDVTLVAAGPDRTRARFVPTFREPQPEQTETEALVEVLHAARAAAAFAGKRVDVVHDHSRASPLTAASRSAPTLVTVHAPVSGLVAEILRALAGSVSLVAVSKAQRATAPELDWLGTVHNGIPVDEYPFREDKDEFVLFLGRLSPEKGVLHAIDASRAAGRDMVLAGSWTTPGERDYFEAQVRPRLGPGVDWAGEVGETEKKRLLSRASCVLFPAQWDEPFGLVAVEAMACGTPVVALRAGALPELVLDGVTGIVCDRTSELAAAIEAACSLDPGRCRSHASERFDAARMAAEYEVLYRRLLRDP